MTHMHTHAPARPWRPSLLIRLSILLHALLLIALLAWTPAWPAILAILCANHLLLAAVGMWPRSTWLGPNWTRLPPGASARGAVALTIDDGPDPDVTPQVLDLLDRYGVKASFFCIGAAAERYPALCQAIVQRGHEIENHTQCHRHVFAFLGPAGLRREIAAAQRTICTITGRRPLFFRAPAGIRSPFLEPVLARLGLRLATWTRRAYDTRVGDPARVARRLLTDLKAGTILLLHDGNCARGGDGVPVILAVLPLVFEAAAAAGLHFVTLSQALERDAV